MTTYTTQQLITNYLGRKLTPEEAGISKMVAEGVTQWIDKYTGTSFKPSASSIYKYYDSGVARVFIDPVIDVEEVCLLDVTDSVVVTYDPTVPDYKLYPLNSGTKTSIQFTGSRLAPLSNSYGADAFYETDTTLASGRIRVKGKWGEAGGIPSDIQLAATILACDWLSDTDQLQSESIEGYSRSFAATKERNPQVDKILDSRKRIVL